MSCSGDELLLPAASEESRPGSFAVGCGFSRRSIWADAGEQSPTLPGGTMLESRNSGNAKQFRYAVTDRRVG